MQSSKDTSGPPMAAIAATAAASGVVYPSDFNGYDVLLGRGSQLVQYPGNVRFREMVYKRRDEYAACVRHHFKDQIAREVIDHVESNMGRFLRKDDSVPSSTAPDRQPWIMADATVVLEKVKQAFRDSFKKPQSDSDQPLVPQPVVTAGGGGGVASATTPPRGVRAAAAAAAAAASQVAGQGETAAAAPSLSSDMMAFIEHRRQQLLLEQYQRDARLEQELREQLVRQATSRYQQQQQQQHQRNQHSPPPQPPQNPGRGGDDNRLLQAVLGQQHSGAVGLNDQFNDDGTILSALMRQRQVQSQIDQIAEQHRRLQMMGGGGGGGNNQSYGMPPPPNHRQGHYQLEAPGMRQREMEQQLLLAAATGARQPQGQGRDDAASILERLVQQSNPNAATTAASSREIGSLESVARFLQQQQSSALPSALRETVDQSPLSRPVAAMPESKLADTPPSDRKREAERSIAEDDGDGAEGESKVNQATAEEDPSGSYDRPTKKQATSGDETSKV